MASTHPRFNAFLKMYDNAHQTRKAYLHKRLRLFIAICAVIFMMLVYAYLTGKYNYLITPLQGGTPFLLTDKLFYWFMAGLLAGAFIAHLTNEAEYLYSVWKLAGKMTSQFGKNVEMEIEKDLGMNNRMKGMKSAKTVKTTSYRRKSRNKR